MLRFYRWCYWKIYWWRGHGEIAVSGEGPEIDDSKNWSRNGNSAGRTFCGGGSSSKGLRRAPVTLHSGHKPAKALFRQVRAGRQPASSLLGRRWTIGQTVAYK